LFIHYTFDIKVAIAGYLLLISALFLFFQWKKGWNPWNRWLMRGVVLAAPLAFIAIELGWITAEVGRQPWMIQGVMLVKDAATTSDQVGILFAMFTLLYVILAVVAVTVLLRLFRQHDPEEELAVREGK
jgi:cytochrome bd ubiquinol oxidase subunit I